MKKYKEPDAVREVHKIREKMSKLPIEELLKRWDVKVTKRELAILKKRWDKN